MLVTADRLWDGTGTASVLRPMVRVSEGRVGSLEQRLLQPATCAGEEEGEGERGA